MKILPLLLLAAVLPISSAFSADPPTRRPAATVATLPAPAAAGPLRILLVDDDLSDNNHNPGDSRLSPSDRVFRQLVADAVGQDAKAWAVEVVKPYESGPGIDQLRKYSLILWYTGASYGGNPDNTAVLGIEDEKTVRRYLEEVGGAVILVSPGYLSKVLAAGNTGDKANWPFLTEVMGIRSGVGLAQRFEAGTVKAPDGASFKVGKGSATVESQFSTISPEGAAVVFTTSLVAAQKSDAPAPVATASPYGRGRIVYVGFTFENLAEADLAPAFRTLLAAAGPQATPSVAGPQAPVKRQAAGSDPGLPTVQVSGTPLKTIVSWTLPTAPIINASIGAPEQTANKPPAAPAAGRTVTVERWTGDTTIVSDEQHWWARMAVQPGASQVVDPAALPGSEQRYRVTVTDASGASGSREVQYKVPAAQDPASLSATMQSDGSVILNWPEVPSVTKYRVQTIPPTKGPRVHSGIVNGATEWRSTPMDGTKRFWTVTSLYEHEGENISLTNFKNWPRAITEGVDQYYLTSGTFTIHTGSDNKEIPSSFEIRLYINGGETKPEDSVNLNPLRLQDIGLSFGSKAVELKVNSSADFKLSTSVDYEWAPSKNNLANIQRHGLRIVIKYLPNFPLDAWKIDQVTLRANFQNVDEISNYRQTGHNYYSPGMENKTITFSNVAKLLTADDSRIDLITDGALRPK